MSTLVPAPHGGAGTVVVRKPWSIWSNSPPQCRRSSPVSRPSSNVGLGLVEDCIFLSVLQSIVTVTRGVNHAKYNLYFYSCATFYYHLFFSIFYFSRCCVIAVEGAVKLIYVRLNNN